MLLAHQNLYEKKAPLRISPSTHLHKVHCTSLCDLNKTPPPPVSILKKKVAKVRFAKNYAFCCVCVTLLLKVRLGDQNSQLSKKEGGRRIMTTRGMMECKDRKVQTMRTIEPTTYLAGQRMMMIQGDRNENAIEKMHRAKTRNSRLSRRTDDDARKT